MIDIIYHDGASAAPDQAGQSGGFAQADGNGEIHCYSWLDGVSAMLMRLEMESYTELRTQKGLLELNFCANGRFETRFSLRDHVLLKPGDMAISCYDGVHGSRSESNFPLGYYEGSSATLEVSAKPWTVVNRDCTWTSSDETVAKVENGVVKAVGAGTCTIKAASVLDPSVTDTCTVTVKEVDHDLSAVIWDADSQSWFSTFNTKTIPNYKKLTEQASRQQIMAAATDTAGITYAASYEEKDGNLYSTLYQVGKDYSLTTPAS